MLPGWPGLLLILAVAAFAAGVLASLTAPGVAYSWSDNMLSDLGHAGCRFWDERWVCSPRHELFNAATAGAGASVLTAVVVVRRAWGASLAASMAILGVGLLVVGLAPADVARPAHLLGAVLTLPVPAAGILWSAVRPGTPRLDRGRVPRVILATIALALSATHLAPDGSILPRGLAESTAAAALCAVLVREGWALWRTPTAPSAGQAPEVGPDPFPAVDGSRATSDGGPG